MVQFGGARQTGDGRMKRSRFTEQQIIGILREQEAGMKTADVCRKHGISEATFYKYKAKFGGMEVSEAKRLKALEDENAKLKKLLAEAMLDNAMLKDVASKKWWSKKGKSDYGKPVLLIYIYEKSVGYNTIKIMIDEVKSESDIKYQINSKMRK